MVKHLLGSNHTSCIGSRRQLEKLIMPLKQLFRATERLNVSRQITSSIANSGS